VELIEIALAPAGCGETQPRDKAEQHHENAERNPVHIVHDYPPALRLVLLRFLESCEAGAAQSAVAK
jgi:hypothetical protein